MAYFPFFMDIEGKRGVILGGGRVAEGKIAALLPFGPQLVCIAPVICGGIERIAASLPEGQGGLRLISRRAQEEDLEGAFFVVAATDSSETNAWAAKLCREKGILINAVDDRKNCSFYFPALVKRGPVVMGISTGGCSPAAAAWLRRKAERMVPEQLGDAAEQLGAVREQVKKSVPRSEARAAVLKRLFAYCEERDFRLEPEELKRVLDGLLPEEEQRQNGRQEGTGSAETGKEADTEGEKRG
ncbi:MAG TPA: bifunctional precorrin-2 dehydrogenase/sirohydrochlorin ferrochelatase [Candidatus Eisenbergiella intestinipullorum]|nr:bifunctional precorrin-2 dehydrogenase/sirohydrochlorin ferrochelatase [Candidatus Eisenbergiella intestinipullorum]